MVQTNYWVKFFTAIFTLFIVISSLTFFNSANATSTDDELGILYLSQYYLVPDKPGDDVGNFTKLAANNVSTFGHNIRDRKLNKKIMPELDLWLYDFGVAGLELEFEIQVQAVEDNTVVPGKKFRMLFQNYSTPGIDDPHNLKLNFINYAGDTFDIAKGKDNWAILTLKISRLDNVTGSDLKIYHGAEGKVSYIKLPWNQTLSEYDYQKEKENENSDTPGFGLGISVISIFIFIAILMYFKGSERLRR